VRAMFVCISRSCGCVCGPGSSVCATDSRKLRGRGRTCGPSRVGDAAAPSVNSIKNANASATFLPTLEIPCRRPFGYKISIIFQTCLFTISFEFFKQDKNNKPCTNDCIICACAKKQPIKLLSCSVKVRDLCEFNSFNK